MKKSSKELEQELKETLEDLQEFHKRYPSFWSYHKGHITKDVEEEYRNLWKKIKNLRININQMKWKEFGVETRKRRMEEDKNTGMQRM